MEVIGDHEGSTRVIGSGFHVFFVKPILGGHVGHEGVLEGSWGVMVVE